MENKNINTGFTADGNGVHAPPSSVFGEPGASLDAMPSEAVSQRPVQAPQIKQTEDARPASRRSSVRLFVGLFLALSLLVTAGGVVFNILGRNNQPADLTSSEILDRYGSITLPLDDLVGSKDLSLADASVTINGTLQVSNSLQLMPSLQPSGAKPGQIYFDQASNQLAYFNGSTFVFLNDTPASGIQSLGGATGELTLGDGLSVANNQLANGGVLSVQGLAGNVTLNAGPGIVINGTTLSNNGILSVAAGTPNVTVTTVAGVVTISVDSPTQGMGTIASSGGTAGRIPVYTAAQNIEDSIITQAGLGISVGGDLQVTGAVTFSSALTVAQGGTGTTVFTSNGVLVGNGASAIGSVAAGGPGLCLISTAGAPTWGVCPGAGGVTSLNSLTGALSIANASAAGSTITIDNASTSAKGIASFNSTNFSVSGGAVNTIQNINTSATPTFAGVITNDIAPTGPLTIGADAQTTLLRGSVTTITSSGSGSDIILNSADTIELQSDTNVTGDLDISGALTAGSVNALQVAASGDISISGLATVAGGSVTVGASSQAGSLILYDGSSNTATLSVAALGQNTSYILPDPGASSATICLTSGNCAGTGGGVTTSGGTLNRLAKFSGAQAIADSSITDTGTTVTTSADLIIQGGDVTVGVANSQTGTINFAHSGSGFLGSILQGALTANRTYTLPDASGIVCLSVGNCSGAGSSNTLQAAYDAGNTITTSDSRDFSLTLANTTIDANFTIDVASGGIGTVAFRRADGAGITDPAQLLLLENLDSDRAQPTGLRIQSAGGGLTTALDATDAEIVTALSVGANDIMGTTGSITYTNVSIAGATGTITTAGDVAVNGGDITSSGTLNITPGGTLSVGVTGQQLTLQGNASTRLTATGGGSTTTIGFTGTPIGNVTYNFDRSITAGTYQICTTIGNCAGAGAGVTSAGGTIGTLAKFTGAQAIGDSLLSESGSVVTVNGNLNLISGNQFRVNGTQISSANLSNDGDLAKLSASQTFLGNTVAFKNGADSTNAFNVQNAGGGRLLTVDTSGGQVVLGTAASLDGRLVFSNASNTDTATLVGGTPTGARTITLPDATGTVCLQSSSACGFVVGVASNFIANSASLQSGATFNISGTGIASTFQSTTFTSSGALGLDSNGTSALNIGTGANAKTVTIGNGTSTTTVNLNTGTGGMNLGTNGVNKTISIGAVGSTVNTTTVNIATSTGAVQTVSIGATNGASTTTIRGGSGNVTAITSAAFQVLNTSSVIQFSVDTGSSRVYIGNPTGDTTGALLVLDTKTDSGDPTGVNGGMYYNSNSGKFRCYEASAWRNCMTYPLVNKYTQTSTQSIPNATDTKIQFPTTAFSEGSSITVVNNNTFTLNKAGIWQLTASVRYDSTNTGGERFISLVDGDNDAVRYAQQNNFPGADVGGPSLTLTATTRFAAGAKVSVVAFQTSGAALNITGPWTYGTNLTLTWIGD